MASCWVACMGCACGPPCLWNPACGCGFVSANATAFLRTPVRFIHRHASTGRYKSKKFAGQAHRNQSCTSCVPQPLCPHRLAGATSLRNYSPIHHRSVPSVAFRSISCMQVSHRQESTLFVACPVLLGQILRTGEILHNLNLRVCRIS